MSQQAKGQGGESPAAIRPAVLNYLTTTQLTEVEQQFEEGDRAGFDRRAEAYGWSADEATAVWTWLGQGWRAAQDAAGPTSDPGRTDDVTGSPVYPISGRRRPPGDAPARDMGPFGQGDRGAAGYEDHGDSEPVPLPPSDHPV
jgi:hypothetical protein